MRLAPQNIPLLAAVLILVALAVSVWASDRPEAHIYQKFKQSECAICSRSNDLEWAHLEPYNMVEGTDRAWTITNKDFGITLCHNCHLYIAHYGNFSRYYNTNLLHIVKELHDGKAEYKSND